ncbi:MAG: sigma-54 interaction domain-containing protein [Gemmatimonadota bacterium]
MTRRLLAVVRLSEAFSDLWPELAGGFESDVRWLDDDTPVPAAAEIAAVLVAAGGVEREALYWLDRWGRGFGPPVFVIGADTGRRLALQTVTRGATDYFALPEDVEVLRNAVASAVAQLDERARSAARELPGAKAKAFQEIVGESPALRSVLQRAERILTHADATALIVGETGTGKELMARAIHNGGPRRAAPFVPVNCSALPGALIESELFGHERGAFTSAHAAKPGLFEVADGGTLFLDEVGTLPLDLQAKLLRALDDREVRRVGGTRSRKVDIRIIAATNEDLKRSMEQQLFRQDLYYRLGVITLEMPPLRERGEDLLLIATAYLKSLAEQYGLPAPPLRPDLRRALLTYHWPGNVRELKNAIERALLLSPPGELEIVELVRPPTASAAAPATSLPFPASLATIMSAAAGATLELCGGNRSEAARRLEISRQRLRRLLDAELEASTHPKTQESGGGEG